MLRWTDCDRTFEAELLRTRIQNTNTVIQCLFSPPNNDNMSRACIKKDMLQSSVLSLCPSIVTLSFPALSE